MTDQLAKLIEIFPDQITFCPFDLTDYQNMRSDLIENQIGTSTPLHGLVVNAAIAYADLVSNMDLSRMEKMFRVNVFSGMELTKQILRNMLLHRTQGSIVFISSVCAHTGYKGLSMYAASKGALEAFSKTTAREWGVKGIRSNCVVAGFAKTDMNSDLPNDVMERIANRTSLKKPTNLESISHTVDFLLSNKAEAITGQNIFVDNGTI